MDATPTAPGRRLSWVVVGGALALLIAVTLGSSLLGLRTFSAVDILAGKAPWRADSPVQSQAQVPFVGDTVDGNLPKAMLLHEGVREGRLPWWSSRPAGGEPILAVPDPGLLSPVALPFWVLPTWLASAWVKVLEITVICLGMVLLFGRLGLARWCGLFAGTAYATSGFMVAWTGWPQTRTAAFLPLLFYAVERLCQDRDARSVVVLAGVVASLVVGGFPAVTAFALLAAGVHLVVRGLLPWAGARHVPRLGVLAVGGIGLGIALAGLQVLPFLSRWNTLDLSYREMAPGTHPPLASAATLLSADVFGLGTPHQRFFGPVNPVEIQAFAGIAVLLLALAAVTLVRLRGPARVTAASFAALAAVVAMITWHGGPLLVLLQQHLPLFSSNPIGRIVSLLGFLLSVLAGMGLHGLAGRSWQPRGIPLFLAGGGIAAVIAALVLRAARADFLTPAMGERLRVLAFLAVVGALLIAAARFGQPRVARTATLLLPVLLVAQALPWVHRWWPQNDPDLFYPSTPVHQVLADGIGHDRMASQGSVPLTGTGLAYGLRAADGHSFVAERWRDLLTAVSPATFVTRTYVTLPVGREVLSSAALDRLSVRLVTTSPETPLYGDLLDPVPTAFTTTLDSTPRLLPLPAGPTRGVAVRVLEAVRTSELRALLRAKVTDGSGRVLSEGAVDVLGPGVRWIPFPDVHVPPGAKVTLSTSRGTTSVAADGSGVPAVGIARVPAGDTLRVIGSGGATVWERTTTLPRLRLATRATVIPDPAARVAALSQGDLPRDEVVLDDGPTRTGSTDAPPRTLRVKRDDDGRLDAQVSEGREPYLVVADNLIGNWRATVNGRDVPLLRADHAFAAVELPDGPAHVVLVARVAGLRTGAAVSAAAVLVALALLTVPGWISRRRDEALLGSSA